MSVSGLKWVEVQRDKHPWLIERDEEHGDLDDEHGVVARYFCPEGELWPMISLSVRPSTVSDMESFKDWVLVSASFKEAEDAYWSDYEGFPLSLLPDLAEIFIAYATALKGDS